MLLLSAAFMPSPSWNAGAVRSPSFSAPPLFLSSQEAADHNSASQTAESEASLEKNSAYINGLFENLTEIVDKYIMTGAPATMKRAYNVLQMIQSEAMDKELVKKSVRLMTRAGLPVAKEVAEAPVDQRANDEKKRLQEAEARKGWESSRTSEVGEAVAANAAGRSALSRRDTNNGKPDLFLGQIDSKLDPRSVAKDKQELERALAEGERSAQDEETMMSDAELAEASAKVSKMVARAGAGSAFKGESLGIGGLDDVLAQVKRRVWIPLAAPPQLLEELGIHPVRGLLLYGKPGCGKTLLASKLGQMLSPLRPITIVNGPEIMDKVRTSRTTNPFVSREAGDDWLFQSCASSSNHCVISRCINSPTLLPFFPLF
jgi:hypothetical protein